MSIKEFLQKIRKATSKRGFVCDCCKRELFDYPATRVCPDCESKFFRNEKHVCTTCGRNAVTEGVCNICKEHPPAFKGISPFVYLGETAGALNRIKNGNRRLCYYYAEQMVRVFQNACSLEEEVVFLPVPMTEEKRCMRGYNQAEDLAVAVADEWTQAGGKATLYTEVLIKKRETKAQKHLSLRERRENLQGVFHLAKRTVLKDKTVVLIDDIMTTGATGDVIARLCQGAGAKQVYFLCVASVPEKQPD